MRHPATDASGRPPFPRAWRRWSGQEIIGKRLPGLRATATRCPERLPALTIPESKTGQARAGPTCISPRRLHLNLIKAGRARCQPREVFADKHPEIVWLSRMLLI